MVGKYIYIGLDGITSDSGTYTQEGILIINDANYNILTEVLAPNMDQFASIEADTNGDVVIGSCYNLNVLSSYWGNGSIHVTRGKIKSIPVDS